MKNTEKTFREAARVRVREGGPLALRGELCAYLGFAGYEGGKGTSESDVAALCVRVFHLPPGLSPADVAMRIRMLGKAGRKLAYRRAKAEAVGAPAGLELGERFRARASVLQIGGVWHAVDRDGVILGEFESRGGAWARADIEGMETI